MDSDMDPKALAALDALIRAATPGTADSPLSRDLLLKYARGETTEAEADQVQAALMGSRELRDELLHLADLLRPDAGATFDSAEVPAPPPRPGTSSATADPAIVALTPRPGTPPQAAKPLIVTLPPRRKKWVWGIGSGLAAAAALVVLFLLPGEQAEIVWGGGETLLVDQFESDLSRGGSTDSLVPRTPAEAATLAWVRRAFWDDGSLSLVDPVDPLAAWKRRVTINLGKPAAVITLLIPEAAENPEIAWLDLDSRQSFRVPLATDNVAASWPMGVPARGLVAVAFLLDGRPLATPAVLVEP